MIDSKRLIEVMPRLSGNEYKVFLYLLYGYAMARDKYNQAYYERSQTEITKDTGVKDSTLKRAIAELEEQRLITCERAQKGSIKARTKYYILDYDTYTVQNDHSIPVQNELFIKDNKDIEEEITNKTVLPDLKPLYDRSKQLGDMLGVQTTIEGINRIKDEFIKLWDDGKALYKYEDRYQADKSKNWEAFRKRYDGVKSRINKSTNTHTPKEDKKDKRDCSEMNGVGAPPRRRSGLEWDMRSFNPNYAAGMDFHPSIINNYLNSLRAFLEKGYRLDEEQLNRAILSVREWIENNWVDGVKEELADVDEEGEVWLSKEQWKEYVRRAITAFNIDPVKPPRIPSSDDDVF